MLDQLSLVSSDRLPPDLKEEYEALLDQADAEHFFYGNPLNRNSDRRVIVVPVDGEQHVVGFFEQGTIEFEGKSYYRTNRPYTGERYRGKGFMAIALKLWYINRKPALCWIDSDNLASIRLFQSVGFRQTKPFFHKGKDGHFYILKIIGA